MDEDLGFWALVWAFLRDFVELARSGEFSISDEEGNGFPEG